MHHARVSTFATSPSLTVALALACGLIVQAIARHVAVPGIVLLLATGVLLGPDGASIVHPESLGTGLHTIVGFAVSVILFEGGLNLNIRRLRREQSAIKRLISLGALVSAVGGALVCHFIMGWEWALAALFGCIVIVTGPTVINPLMKRLRVDHSVATVLEAEGILGDAVGAVCAAVALELVLGPDHATFANAVWYIFSRLAVGSLIGAASGLAIALALRFRGLVPEGLQNVMTLTLVFLIYQAAHAVVPESGIVAVIIAGFVVGNMRTPLHHDLHEFKEQLTVMLIGMLFILLAADVRLSQVRALGWRGVAATAIMLVLVRPLSVLAGTAGTQLGWRQRVFVGFIGPRGIVAAAVTSLFATALTGAGVAGGQELRALIFLVIISSVLAAGLGGGLVGKLLGLRRPSDAGWVILGAHTLGRCVARALKQAGQDIVLIDANADAVKAAEADGLKVIYGNALEARTVGRAAMDTRAGCVGLTRNEDVNLLFAKNVRELIKHHRVFVSIGHRKLGVTPDMVLDAGCDVWSGRSQDVDLWASRLERNDARLERWMMTAPTGNYAALADRLGTETLGLALCSQRDGRTYLTGTRTTLGRGDVFSFLVWNARADDFQAVLSEAGFKPATQ